jgi:ferrous iron transport protein B
MAAEVNNTGKKVFNFASGISLLLFMPLLQCASTLAITQRDPNGR